MSLKFFVHVVYSKQLSAHSEHASSGRLQGLKKNGKSITFQAKKVVAVAVAVAYRRWSFTRGSNCKALTGKALVFWIGGRL